MSEIAIIPREDFEQLKKDIRLLVDIAHKKTGALSEYCTEEELIEKLTDPETGTPPSATTLWRWRKNGQLPKPISIGDKRLYKIADLLTPSKK
jgi:hypothetical protein